MAGLLKPASQKSKIRRLGNQPTDNPGRNPSTRPSCIHVGDCVVGFGAADKGLRCASSVGRMVGKIVDVYSCCHGFSPQRCSRGGGIRLGLILTDYGTSSFSRRQSSLDVRCRLIFWVIRCMKLTVSQNIPLVYKNKI